MRDLAQEPTTTTTRRASTDRRRGHHPRGLLRATAVAPATIDLPTRGPGRIAGLLVVATFAALLVPACIGGTLSGADHLGTLVLATGLYTVAGIGFGALLTVSLLLQHAAVRRRPVPRWTVDGLLTGSSLASTALLAAAYVSRLGEGHFIGGPGAMVALVASLVLLARRVARRA